MHRLGLGQAHVVKRMWMLAFHNLLNKFAQLASPEAIAFPVL